MRSLSVLERRSGWVVKDTNGVDKKKQTFNVQRSTVNQLAFKNFNRQTIKAGAGHMMDA